MTKSFLVGFWVWVVFLALGPLKGAEEPTFYKIQNRWLGDQALFDDGGKVSYGSGSGDAYLWSLEEKAGLARIKNKGTGHYMAVPNGGTDVMAVDSLDDSDATTQWVVLPVVKPWSGLKNEGNSKFVNIEGKLGHAVCDSDAAPNDSENGHWASQWNLAYVSGPIPPPPVVRGQIGVTSPAYGSDVQGDTNLTITAPGFASVEVKCWQQGGEFGSDSTVGTVTLDDSGKGELVFPANKYPHGPITVRISGEGGGMKDTCNLQLYNKGGVSWNEGIPKDAPPPAEGMSLVYADDFSGPLSISKTGAGATYYSHKPGGGDFGKLPFTDFEAPNNPFSQVDTYLRIRADANKNSTGLISSLKKDGTGIMAKAPCYFECRFIAQNATGTWPAFWLMTRDVYKGLKEPADELDVIEGYGGFGPGNPNQTGYWTTTHTWNQKEKPLGGVYKQYPMTKFGGHSSWWETFHIYGCKITETDTIYYCDNIEVARHPTNPLSKTRPFFFLINLAVPGAGWHMDLSRYGGIADMYVDYVRVYQGAGGDAQ
jgi:hypothetical protein